MEFYTIHCPMCITPFPKHNWIKKKLLKLIDEAEFETLKPINQDTGVVEIDGYRDNDDISRLDWKKSSNLERPWVKYFWPYLESVFGTISGKLAYTGVQVMNIWFQQYLRNGTHGWHTHSDNYTGVYYLEFPEGSPPTELSQNGESILLNVKEGDFVTFPSFVYHRAPKVENVDRKTIISFNVNFQSTGNYGS